MASDRMMEYYYSMGQDSLGSGQYDQAVTYFRKAANLGASEAVDELLDMAECFAKGNGVTKDPAMAARCYEICSGFNRPEADLALGKLYLRGVNGVSNPRRAKRFLVRASEAGSREAAALLAKIYDEGLMGRVNTKQAFKYYLLAAERGDRDSMLMTGLFYAQGTTVPKDIVAAETWIRKGRGEGSPDGDNTLRVFLSIACTEYVNGASGMVDPGKAMRMAEEAEELGDKEVFLHLGRAFVRAGTVPDHNEKAFECFRRASLVHIPAAYAEMGVCLEQGIGVERNIKEAVRYYKKAAEKGDLLGMTHYGLSLAQGAGIRKNTRRGMEWLMKAALRGDLGAVRILREDFNYEV